jgi:IMP dehydrogenase
MARASESSDRFSREGVTFDDVLLVPAESAVLPKDVSTRTRLFDQFDLALPIISSAMDTVTDANMAIAMARNGGLGVVHRSMTTEEQCDEVDRVKRSESGMITDPITLHPDDYVPRALDLMKKYRISGVPITDDTGKLVGILTNRDLAWVDDKDQPIRNVMTSKNLITAPVGTTLEEAKQTLAKHRIEKLPVVDDTGRLTGLITVKDLRKKEQYPNATKDPQGRLCVAAAVGVGDDGLKRAFALREVAADFIVVDTAHGHAQSVVETVRELVKQLDCPIVGGNIATAEAAEALIVAGASGVKVGVGPGSICTTRIVAGVGVPQLTAISDVAAVTNKHGATLIADGGIQFSGDIAKALAAGADAVMLGGLLAGTEESPGDVIFVQGERYKDYRGMGSLGAMKSRTSSKDRYFQGDITNEDKLVPEGVEGRVPYKGSVGSVLYQLVGGLRQAMGYVGASTVSDLQKAKFIRMSGNGLRESHPHDVMITNEPPNYSMFRRSGDD